MSPCMSRGINPVSGLGRRLAVIPMKDPSRSKTRLGRALPPEARAALAERLFRATLAALQDATRTLPRVDIAVVSDSPRVAAITRAMGLTAIDDGAPGSLSLAVTAAADWATARGYEALCVLPGDLAAPRAAELTRLLRVPLDGDRVVICPAKDLGTNALLTPLPVRFPFCYGPKSLIAHSQAAEAAGLFPVILPLASLKLDVDTAEDLSHLHASDPCARIQEGAQ